MLCNAAPSTAWGPLHAVNIGITGVDVVTAAAAAAMRKVLISTHGHGCKVALRGRLMLQRLLWFGGRYLVHLFFSLSLQCVLPPVLLLTLLLLLYLHLHLLHLLLMVLPLCLLLTQALL